MKFMPINREELQRSGNNLTEGDVDFEIVKASDEISKTNNEMIKLTLKCFGPNKTSGFIFDYISSTAQWKICQFLDSIGLSKKYESGNIDADSLVGMSGKAKLVLDKKSDRPQIKIQEYYPSKSINQEPEEDWGL